VLALLPLADPLDAPVLSGAIVAAYATTMDGTPLYARNEALRVMPASNQKLFSAAFALHALGPDARQQTRIWKEADRNVVEAEGDPLLTRADLLKLDLDRRRPVFIAQTYAPGIPSGWEEDDLYNRYAASVYAFSVDTASFELWAENGKPKLRPETYGVKIERQKAEKLGWNYDPFRRKLIVRGPLPEKPTRLDTFATPRADFAAASLLGSRPKTTTEVPSRAPDIVLPGHTTVEAVAACLPPSDNNIAEHLLLNAAAKFGPLGSDPYDVATSRLRAFAERTVGLPFEDVLPRDGSGLGRGNLVTARAMVGLLRWADRQPTRDLWRNALAKAGGPGTLRNRLTDVGFWGKTGSLSRVAALSGYLKRRDGSEAVVSVIVNHYSGSDAAVRAAMDAWVRSLGL
jgi:serine-type D-Ala-D-Ala carboxypeptidase/endopeptidase (penicillin-binding protein 4)